MRCKSREDPWGSHHVEASALKWLTSSGDTEDGLGWEEEECVFRRNCDCTKRGAVRRSRLRLRRDVGRRGVREAIAERRIWRWDRRRSRTELVIVDYLMSVLFWIIAWVRLTNMVDVHNKDPGSHLAQERHRDNSDSAGSVLLWKMMDLSRSHHIQALQSPLHTPSYIYQLHTPTFLLWRRVIIHHF